MNDVSTHSSKCSADLTGKHILVTHADQFMGPVLAECLTGCGASVVSSTEPLKSASEVSRVVQAMGQIDCLVANLAMPAPQTLASDVSDAEWSLVFKTMVDPLHWLVRAVLPQMIERRHGKILLMGSASALRGINKTSSYCAARGAQISFIQAVGVEVARHNVQVNAIAQNFVDNETYFPEEVQQNPAFQKRLKNEVPLGRLVGKYEDAGFAAYLCSDAADCFVGQVFPVCGGWVAR